MCIGTERYYIRSLVFFFLVRFEYDTPNMLEPGIWSVFYILSFWDRVVVIISLYVFRIYFIFVWFVSLYNFIHVLLVQPKTVLMYFSNSKRNHFKSWKRPISSFRCTNKFNYVFFVKYQIKLNLIRSFYPCLPLKDIRLFTIVVFLISFIGYMVILWFSSGKFLSLFYFYGSWM